MTGALTGWCADELPFPQDAHVLDAPIEMAIGSQPMRLKGFTTWLSMEEVKAFYEKALPAQGWRIEPSPWIAQAEQNRKRFEEFQRTHVDEIKNDPSYRTAVATANASKAVDDMKHQQLYASRRQERLLMQVAPQSDYRAPTVVTISRWEVSTTGTDRGMFDAGVSSPRGSGDRSVPQAGIPSTGGSTNSCCAGEPVPLALRKLPSSIPSYPSAQILFSGGAPTAKQSKQTAVVEMAVTEDPLEQVTDYYQHQMAYHGWSLVELPAGRVPDARQLLGSQMQGLVTGMKTFSFQNDQARCQVSIVEQPKDIAGAVGRMAGLSDQFLAAAGSSQANSKARTTIFVTYFESKTVSDYLRRIAPRGVVYGQ